MKSRRKTLILASLDWTRPKDPPSSLGHASILANLYRHKIPTIAKSWSVNQLDFNADDVSQFIMSHANETTDVALGAFVWNEPYLQEILKKIRSQSFPGKIILGGPQVSYVKRGLEKYYPTADIFIRGYAEEALAQLFLSADDKPAIQGIHYAGDQDVGRSALSNLEELPSPFLSGVITPQRFIRWEAQRGCPFRCSFCQHRESDDSMMRRHFSQSRIMQEIAWLTSFPIIQDIAVLDPTFNAGPNYLSIINAFSKNKYTGKLALQCRTEMITENFLDAIQELNETAHVVLELGLQTIHKAEQKLIGRPNNMAKIKEVLAETRQRNIATEVSLMFGLPGQTVSSFEASVDFCKKERVPTLHAYPLMLLRGTPLYDEKEQLGLIESKDIASDKIDRVQEHIPHVVESRTFSRLEWQVMAGIAASLDEYNANNKMRSTLAHTLWATKKNTLSRSITAEQRKNFGSL